MTTTIPRARTVIRRWPLWLGILLVAVSTTVLVGLFATSAGTSERALAERHSATAAALTWHDLQGRVRAIERDAAVCILTRNAGGLAGAAKRAAAVRAQVDALDTAMAGPAVRFERGLSAIAAAASAGDWDLAAERQLRLTAQAGLSKVMEGAASRDRVRWQAADEATSPFDQRSTTFPQVVSLTGLMLVLGAALLGGVASRSLTQQRRARRRADEDAERADALEAAVGARTVDLVEANALLEREMAERGVAEAQLRQAQKMEAIGQLTGGIAHDFNNMLAVVVGGIELAKRRADEPSQVARHLDRAMEGCERAVALTRRLLSFARAEPANARMLSLNAIVAGVSDMLERTLGEQVRVRLDLAPDLPPVLVDRSPLENAILNLAVNARDAMPKGGALTLATRHDQTLGAVELAVTDTGVGMDAAVRERALEPFFTTKPSGQGTGLGLSQIFGLVSAAKGAMAIDSAPGQGTTIRITLPAHPDARPSDGEDDELAEAYGPSAPLAVLVVEDDPRVRRSTVSALEASGHRVRACSDGAAALALVRGGNMVELVVSDVVMPGLSGPDMARELERSGRALPILFVTGYADTQQAEVLTRYELLRKPFTVDQLDRAIARALDRFSESPPSGSGTAAAKAHPAEAAGAATG